MKNTLEVINGKFKCDICYNEKNKLVLLEDRDVCSHVWICKPCLLKALEAISG